MNKITITEAAAEKVISLIKEENNSTLKLRVYVEGGGCSGFKYGFAFEHETKEDDLTFVEHGVTLVVDCFSNQYLLGAEIDYKDDKLNGSHFLIRNLQAAKSMCGCGSSFSA